MTETPPLPPPGYLPGQSQQGEPKGLLRLAAGGLTVNIHDPAVARRIMDQLKPDTKQADGPTVSSREEEPARPVRLGRAVVPMHDQHTVARRDALLKRVQEDLAQRKAKAKR